MAPVHIYIIWSTKYIGIEQPLPFNGIMVLHSNLFRFRISTFFGPHCKCTFAGGPKALVVPVPNHSTWNSVWILFHETVQFFVVRNCLDRISTWFLTPIKICKCKLNLFPDCLPLCWFMLFGLMVPMSTQFVVLPLTLGNTAVTSKEFHRITRRAPIQTRAWEHSCHQHHQDLPMECKSWTNIYSDKVDYRATSSSHAGAWITSGLV